MAIDQFGNFAVAWVGEAVESSFFNGVYVQRFTRGGTPIGTETQVNTETTDNSTEPFVGMSRDGRYMVLWQDTALPRTNQIDGVLYDANGNMLADYQPAGPNAAGPLSGSDFTDSGHYVTSGPLASLLPTLQYSPNPSVAFDAVDNYTVSYSIYANVDNTPPAKPAQFSLGVYMEEFAGGETINAGEALVPGVPAGSVIPLGTVLKGVTRVNSAVSPISFGNGILDNIGFYPAGYATVTDTEGIDQSGNATWPGQQGNEQVAINANGDTTVSYEGFGPNVTETASTAEPPTINTGMSGTSIMDAILAQPSNGDLTAAWPGLANLSLPFGLDNDGDEDSEIEEVLIEAQKNYAFTDAMLGRLDAIMNEVVTDLRGEAQGVMYTQFDADPVLGTDNILSSDNIVNTTRDGTNDRWLISIPSDATSGSFNIQLTNEATTRNVVLTINPVYTTGSNPVVDPTGTLKAIQSAIQSAIQEVGINWPTAQNSNNLGGYPGPINVRLISDQEITEREGTHWDLTPYGIDTTQYVYEILFIGEVHNTEMNIVAQPGNPKWNQLMVNQGGTTVAAPDPLFVEETPATPGTYDHDASIGMTANGNFVIAYTQSDQDSFGDASTDQVMFQTYPAVSDSGAPVNTVGPTLAGVTAPGATIQSALGVTENSNPPVIDPGGQVKVNTGLQHLVVAFSENMMVYDNTTLSSAESQATAWQLAHPGQPLPASIAQVLDSVTNPANYQLLLNGKPVSGAIASVQYGMNEAANLAAMYAADPTDYSQYADLSPVPTNHWEAVITLDGDPAQPGNHPLTGNNFNYSIELLAPTNPGTNYATSGLCNVYGNALGRTGFTPNGQNFAMSFTLIVTNQGDQSASQSGVNGRTYPQSPDAVAVDAKGDTIAAWTAYDATLKHDQAYIRLYNSAGVPTSGIIGVTAPDTPFAGDDERYVGVACDADGDFVVTWTDYRSGQNSAIYAERFTSVGTPVVGPDTDSFGAFQVNTYTAGNTRWSTVAMDTDGDFVITWSSYGESGSGNGYDIYARRFSSYGTALAPEFRVNVDVGGNQQFSSVALGEGGNFLIVWQSDQTGADEIYGRAFGPTAWRSPRCKPAGATAARWPAIPASTPARTPTPTKCTPTWR